MTTDELKQALSNAIEQAPDATIADAITVYLAAKRNRSAPVRCGLRERSERMTDTERIAELEATVQRLESDKRRLIAQIPYENLRYIINSHPNLRFDIRTEVKRWLDTMKVAHD